jgi:hypothetical protein
MEFAGMLEEEASMVVAVVVADDEAMSRREAERSFMI